MKPYFLEQKDTEPYFLFPKTGTDSIEGICGKIPENEMKPYFLERKRHGTIFPCSKNWHGFRLRDLRKVSRKWNETIFPWTEKTRNHISLFRKLAQIPFKGFAQSFQKMNWNHISLNEKDREPYFLVQKSARTWLSLNGKCLHIITKYRHLFWSDTSIQKVYIQEQKDPQPKSITVKKPQSNPTVNDTDFRHGKCQHTSNPPKIRYQ